MEYLSTFKKILEVAIKEEASDVLISVGHPPMIRVTGQLIPVLSEKTVTGEMSDGFAAALLGEERKKKFMAQKEVDLSYDLDGKGRFRVNIFFQRGTVSLALRLIPSQIKTIENLSLPAILHEFTQKTQGLLLVCGASGQGKSTTMAAMLDEINHTRAAHIITIEDPIEYIYQSDKSIIDQREVPGDTQGFPQALKATFRQNPDVIMVGEMRDLETISTTITAAETGHLVFATLHTNSAAQSINRMVDVFPAEQQNQVRFQLASSLLGVISQRLIPRIKGGFIPICEVMICNNAVSNLIRENKNFEIPAVIETSAKEGMISLNRALADLVRQKEISLKSAMDHSVNPLELKNLVM